jgi:hypothetical protein
MRKTYASDETPLVGTWNKIPTSEHPPGIYLMGQHLGKPGGRVMRGKQDFPRLQHPRSGIG